MLDSVSNSIGSLVSEFVEATGAAVPAEPYYREPLEPYDRVKSHKCADDPCPWLFKASNEYFCGDSRLGPTTLPTRLIIAPSIMKYSRLGGYSCPTVFLTQFYDEKEDTFIYPPCHGFQCSSDGNPILGEQRLLPGMLIDRFGRDEGCYLSPADTPFTQRALPPRSLNTPPDDRSYPYNYRVYKVEKEFDVWSGPIAAWFGQPGQGTQYQTKRSVQVLVDEGYLSKVDLKTHSVLSGEQGTPIPP